MHISTGSDMEEQIWKKWLDEPVVWRYLEKVPRRVALARFVKGLIGFIQSHGYVFDVLPNELGSNLATGLFKNRDSMDGNWRFGMREELYDETEYKNYYEMYIGDEAWENFWKRWGGWCDVDEKQRQYEIQSYVWTQLSIEKSRPTSIVNQLLGIDEDQEDVSEHDSKDTYLKDSNESNEWGGYRK